MQNPRGQVSQSTVDQKHPDNGKGYPGFMERQPNVKVIGGAKGRGKMVDRSRLTENQGADD